MVGFFVENQYPPFVMINRKVAAFLYIQTKQFSEGLCNSPDRVVHVLYEPFVPDALI